MFIDDYIEKITLQEELENVKEQLKAVQDENAKLKTTIDRHCKAGMERIDILNNKNETIATLTAEVHKLKGELNILKYSNSVKERKIKTLEAKIEMLENDRKEGLKACCNCSHRFQDRIHGLEDEIDQLKRNPSTVSDSELLAIHTADVETINKLNIRARDLNSTISTLLERVSTYGKENQELKKKVQELNDFIQRI